MLLAGNGSPAGYDVPGACCRYICIVGGEPSGGVFMLALSTWLPSGSPLSVEAPSMVLVWTASWPLPCFDALECSKLPAASVNPIGLASRWSWNLLTK